MHRHSHMCLPPGVPTRKFIFVSTHLSADCQVTFCGQIFLGLQEQPALVPGPFNVPLLRGLWSLLDGISGVLKGSWGVLVVMNPYLVCRVLTIIVELAAESSVL